MPANNMNHDLQRILALAAILAPVAYGIALLIVLPFLRAVGFIESPAVEGPRSSGRSPRARHKSPAARRPFPR
jgi:hypothetical protein